MIIRSESLFLVRHMNRGGGGAFNKVFPIQVVIKRATFKPQSSMKDLAETRCLYKIEMRLWLLLLLGIEFAFKGVQCRRVSYILF